jgi:talin
VDMDDPNVVAEQELLSAAATIEAAAKKLATLTPKVRAHSLRRVCHAGKNEEPTRAILSLLPSALVATLTLSQKEHRQSMYKELPFQEQILEACRCGPATEWPLAR